jgi:hypothetical protein
VFDGQRPRAQGLGKDSRVLLEFRGLERIVIHNHDRAFLDAADQDFAHGAPMALITAVNGAIRPQ